MLTINVTSNIDETIKRLQAQAKQVPFAIAKSLTQTAVGGRSDAMAALPTEFDRPVPFTMRGIGYTPANKSTLTATVFIREAQARYLGLYVSGATERPKKRALLTPEGIDLNAYGNMPARKVKQLLARKDVFSGKVRGIPGIWQRIGPGKVKLLIRYTDQRKVERRFDFQKIVADSVRRNFGRHFQAALEQAMRTAR